MPGVLLGHPELLGLSSVSGVLGCLEMAEGKDGGNMLRVPVSLAAWLRRSAATTQEKSETAWLLRDGERSVMYSSHGHLGGISGDFPKAAET